MRMHKKEEVMFQFLTTDAAAGQPMSPMGTLLYWVVLIGAFGLMFYFMAKSITRKATTTRTPFIQ